MNNRREGLLGEHTAVEYLRSKGYDILERNYSTKFGEIDVIAEKGETVVFVEIKARENTRFGMPVEAVTREKQIKIISAANYYIVKKKLTRRAVRFDVIAVLRDDIEHIENAFDAVTARFSSKFGY